MRGKKSGSGGVIFLKVYKNRNPYIFKWGPKCPDYRWSNIHIWKETYF